MATPTRITIQTVRSLQRLRLNEETGRVLVELDLSIISLPFLQYDWRTAGEVYDEEPEGANYDDNPRGTIEFGSYRGHDRVLNWKEIYVGSGQ